MNIPYIIIKSPNGEYCEYDEMSPDQDMNISFNIKLLNNRGVIFYLPERAKYSSYDIDETDQESIEIIVNLPDDYGAVFYMPANVKSVNTVSKNKKTYLAVGVLDKNAVIEKLRFENCHWSCATSLTLEKLRVVETVNTFQKDEERNKSLLGVMQGPPLKLISDGKEYILRW